MLSAQVLLVWSAFRVDLSSCVVPHRSNLGITGSISTREQIRNSSISWKKMAIRIAPTGHTSLSRKAGACLGKKQSPNFGTQPGAPLLRHGTWDLTQTDKPIF